MMPLIFTNTIFHVCVLTYLCPTLLQFLHSVTILSLKKHYFPFNFCSLFYLCLLFSLLRQSGSEVVYKGHKVFHTKCKISNQSDKISLFLKVQRTNFRTTAAQILDNYLGYFEKWHFLSKICFGFNLGRIGLLFITTSGHTISDGQKSADYGKLFHKNKSLLILSIYYNLLEVYALDDLDVVRTTGSQFSVTRLGYF